MKILIYCTHLVLIVCATSVVAEEPKGIAHYMANEGLMVVHGDTKILFDPLFRNDYGQYQLVPNKMEQALFAGIPPWDGIDAVFISHHHGDHFSPMDILTLLKAQNTIQLYAPAQAISGLREVASMEDEALFERVTSIELSYKETPVILESEGLLIEAVRIPHAGWPERNADIQNITYRVTLDEEITILHLGDADARDIHYAHDATYWDKRYTQMAFPPYWYFMSEEGNRILSNRLKPGHSVGIHVPKHMPDITSDRPPELQKYDLFTRPGETRKIK